jgi:hypothetical protein
MSALARFPRALDDCRRPSLFGLLRAVLAGEVLGAVMLWVISIVLAIPGIAPFGGDQRWVWLPWQIDGLWALVGALGWGYLVATLVARLVTDSIERRGYGRPAAVWLRFAIAISGYGAMAVGHTAAAHVFVAVVGAAAVIRLLVFNLDGSPRPWRWAVPRRARLAGVIAAALIALSYSATHAFAGDGSGGSYATGTILTHVGQTETVSVGLSEIRLPVDVTAATFSGPGSAHLRVSSLGLGMDDSHALRLPYRLGAGKGLWISATVKLTSCANATVNTFKLGYTVLGIATSESIPLQQPLSLSCRG